jgi:hypothetical protein
MLKMSANRIDRAYLEEWVETLGLGETWKLILSRLNT